MLHMTMTIKSHDTYDLIVIYTWHVLLFLCSIGKWLQKFVNENRLNFLLTMTFCLFLVSNLLFHEKIDLMLFENFFFFLILVLMHGMISNHIYKDSQCHHLISCKTHLSSRVKRILSIYTCWTGDNFSFKLFKNVRL